MAFNMSGEAVLPAARPQVWALLNDPATLKTAIPGCESLERTGDHGFAAVTKLKIGPVSATFRGKVHLTDIVPAESCTITGEGEGGVAGFAKGGARIRLTDADGGGTRLAYDVDAQVGGKIAQLGSRLIDGVAKGMADKFFAGFAQAAAASAAAAPAPVMSPAAFGAEPEMAAPVAVPASPAPVAEVMPARAPPAAAPPHKTSWFRRIIEWFRSLFG